MPFGNITVNSRTFNPRIPGEYSLSTVAYNDPANSLRIKGATRSKDSILRGSMSRIIQKDVTVGSSVVRKTATITVSLQVPDKDFTATEIDDALSDLSAFATSDTVGRLLLGES